MNLVRETGAVTENAVLATNGTPDEQFQSVSARMTTLDNFAGEQGLTACDLIKVDIEGAELMFLRGGQAFLRKHRPVIYGEFNSFWMERFGQSFLDVAELIREWDYQIFVQGEPGKFRKVTVPEAGLQEVLLVPGEKPREFLMKLGIEE